VTDPIPDAGEAAARRAAEEQALRAVTAARCRLILARDAANCFFATLALRLSVRADRSVATLATDGRRLLVNPAFVAGLAPDELLGCVAHEVMHNALAHFARRGGRDPAAWNVACDLAVNPLLLSANFRLPAGRLVPGEGPFAALPAGRSAEEYYALLAERPPGGSTSGRPRGRDPGGCGEVLDAAPSPAGVRALTAEWDVAVAEAHQAARRRGTLPAGLGRAAGRPSPTSTDWRTILRDFLSTQARDDYSWVPPDRRFVHRGVYLPGLRGVRLGEVVIAVDTSGSVDDRQLASFAAEVHAILDAYDCTASVLYHDAQVHRVRQWRSGDGPLAFEPAGGGGTSHRCVFEWLEAAARPVACVVCLTDLETEFPDVPPAVPVLWAVAGDVKDPPPFGRVVRLAP
jgi:predicted metal-dependent peptidase